MMIQQTVTIILAVAGLIFMTVSLIGLIRFPDFFTRLHAQGVGDTLGALLIVLAMAVSAGASLISLKIILVFLLIMLTNPVGTNLMMNAAVRYTDYQDYSHIMIKGTDPASTEPEEFIRLQSDSNKQVSEPDKLHSDTKENRNSDTKEKKAVPKPEITIQEKPDIDLSGQRISNKPDSGSSGPAKQDEPDKPSKQVKPTKSDKPSKQARPSKTTKPSMKKNKAELIAIASEMGIDVPDSATKKEILELIEFSSAVNEHIAANNRGNKTPKDKKTSAAGDKGKRKSGSNGKNNAPRKNEGAGKGTSENKKRSNTNNKNNRNNRNKKTEKSNNTGNSKKSKDAGNKEE